MLEKTFGLGEVYVAKMTSRGEPIGEFILFIPSGKTVKNPRIVEIYARQVGLLIERKRNEDKLTKAKDDYKLITNLTGDIIVQVDIEGRWTFLNDTACDFWGDSRENLIGQLFSEYLHPDDQEETSVYIAKNARSGDVEKGLVNRQRTPKGWRIVQWNGSPIYRNGEYMGFQATGRDITAQKEIELKLIEKEEELNEAQHMAQLGRWDYYHDENRLRWAKTIFDIFEIDSERFEATYEAFYTAIHPDDRITVDKVWKESLVDKKPYAIEHRLLMDDGRIKWVKEQCRTDFNELGHPVRSIGIVQDITERKQAVEKIKESELRFKTLFNDSPVSILIHDKDTGGIIDANELAWTSYGLKSLSDLQNNDFWMESPYSGDDTLRWIQKATSEGTQRFEWKNRKVTGEIFWEHVVLRPVTIDGIERVISTTLDITGRKTAEEEVLAKQQELDTYFTSSLDLLCISNTKGEFIRLNPEWEKILEYSIKDLEGKSFLDYVHPDDLSSTLEAIAALDNQQEVKSFVNRYRSKSGAYRWIEWRAKPIGKQIYAVARDVTRRIEYEKKLKNLNSHQAILLDVSVQLMNAKPENLASIVQKTMGEIAKVTLADRVYVFNYDFYKQVCNNTFEWCSDGIVPQIDALQNIPLDECCEWLTHHEKNETVVIDDVSAMPEGDPIKNILEPQAIRSLISVPLFTGGQLYGFIGFDDVKKKHSYTAQDKAMLQQYGNNLLSTITRIEYIHNLRKSEDKNRYEKERFKTTLLSVGDGVISTDIQGNVVIMNKISEQLTGWTQEESIGKPIEKVFNISNEFTRERCENPVHKVLETGDTLELANHTLLIAKDGTERPIEDSAAPIRDKHGNITGVVLVFRDFTEKKKNQDKIIYLSYYDHLTGLYNRRFFEAELKRLDTKRNWPLTIVMGDVNGLKLINDSFGHTTGDQLLIKTAEVLRNGCRADDIIARIGGDEFVILLPKTDDFEAQELINRIQGLLKKDRVADLEISISFGYETKTSEVEEIESMLKKAEDRMYHNKLFEGPSIRGRVIDNIMNAINSKSKREEAHSKRVSELCFRMGEALGLEEYKIKELKAFGLLHDIGKIAISDSILNKPGELTDNEWIEMRRHSETGYRILSTANHMSEIAEYVLTHHERWDGNGYPKGLKGEDIPFESRIIAIADAYDAMTSVRSYKAALPKDAALAELRNNAGKQFDPELVKVFVNMVIC